jgi:hypothetical protein
MRTLATLMDGHRSGDPEELADTILATLSRTHPEATDDLVLLIAAWSF